MFHNFFVSSFYSHTFSGFSSRDFEEVGVFGEVIVFMSVFSVSKEARMFYGVNGISRLAAVVAIEIHTDETIIS